MIFKEIPLLLKKTSICSLFLFGSMCLPNALSVAYAEDADAGVASMQPAEEVMQESNVDELGAPTDVWERARRGYAMQTLSGPLVDKWLRHYSRDPAYLNRMFERSGRYLYHILEEVEDRGMPTELALLPFVESAFQPEALSRAKAAGLWQFMPATGAQYALAQNLWRDDRRDVLESTRAALDYFQYLYGMFNDWHLALAAYNWGEGSVQRAVRRQKRRGLSTDYQHLRMPNETANYVPKLEAIKRIVAEPHKYGIKLPEVGNEPYFVSITKPSDIDTKTAAELAGMSLKDFKLLNPSYKLPVIVAAHNNVMLLPADKVDDFIDNLVSWMDGGQPLSRWTTYKLQSGETLAAVAERTGMTEDDLREVNGIPKGRKVLANSTLLVRANSDEQSDISIDEADAKLRLSPLTTWRRVTYRVRRGDTLSGIARRWHITTRSIVKANRLRSSRLRIGQRLILTVPNVERSPITYARSSSGGSTRHKIHAVRSGETLSTISNRYGVSIAQLKATNRLRSSVIRAGQRLRIPAGNVSYEEASETIYRVRSGDTLSSIASRYGVSVTRLKRANRLTGNTLRVGQKLEIPTAERKRVATQQRRTSSSGTSVYRVRSGDSLYEIGRRYGVSVSNLKAANGLRGNNLRVGQNLVIPATAKNKPSSARASGKTYRVRSGDTLYEIANRYGTSVKKLKSINGLKRNTLRVGQVLQLP